MSLVDIKEVEKLAKKEIVEETQKVAVEKLKELYRRKEKAVLVVKNLDREIAGYLNDISELTIYESAGVDTSDT